MLSAYYKIWVDAIRLAQKSKAESQSWKVFTMIQISILQGINLATILLFIRSFSNRKFTVVLPVHLFNITIADTAVSLLLTFFLPFVILNYLLIFNNDRYGRLINTYKSRSRKWYVWYAAITLGIFFIPYIVKIIF
jgi:hypothetical protein